MTSILNLFSNFDDLSKKKSIIDYASDFKEIKTSYTPALTQGQKYKKYQGLIKKNLEKNIRKIKLEEGFDNLNVDNNGLYIQTKNIIQDNDYSSQKQTIENLKTVFQNTLSEYQNLISQLTDKTTEYLNRVNPNNPYLGKNIRSVNGAIFYVTHQGIAKLYPNIDIYNNTVGLNGCPDAGWEDVDFTWTSDYVEGTILPTNPPLLVGSNMIAGQSCGNEGSNIYVNSLVNNPISKYIGCYNNNAPITLIRFNPIMDSSNFANGYTTNASSVYHNDNTAFGPWRAFDNNNNTWWHTYADSDGNPYNNGIYIGNTSVSFINSSNQQENVKGEFLKLEISDNSPIPLVKYDLVGRLDCCGKPNGRDPNSWYILGYNTSDGQWYQVDYQSNISFNFQMKTFTVQNPQSYGAYVILITVAGDSNAPPNERTCVQISTWNLYTSSNYISNSITAMSNSGIMSFDQCSSYALSTGNQYFGLQGIDSNGNGNCMLSNSIANSQMYGEANIFTEILLWASNTGSSENGKDTGSISSLSKNGSLNVFNSSGLSIFSTDSKSSLPSNYLGCYNDCYLGRGLPTSITTGSTAGSTYETCNAAAQNGNWKYFGLQFTQPNGTSECWVGNDINSGRSMGKASNCTTANNVPVGGSCSNAIYTTDSTSGSFYFLLLQDDGNMCIYRGTSPSDNQGEIWCSMTNGKQLEPNPSFAASKGKTGQNWMGSGTTLAQGEFIGSTNGSIYLIMQSDGNLVLYTNSKVSGCSISSVDGNKNVGQSNINALYKINSIGNKNELGKLAYIDPNANLHSYPNSNIQYSESYSKLEGTNSSGNDIPGTAFGGATLEQCKSSCNNNSSCAGFVISTNGNVCSPKTSSIYPNGELQIDSNSTLYVRGMEPKQSPIGIPNSVNNIDTVIYQNYINGGNFDNSYGLENATSVQKQQLENLQSKMNLLSSQIVNLTDKFGSGSEQAGNQLNTNINGLKEYIKGYQQTNDKIKGFSTNMDNILNDSDIVVLQKNYDYLFWSIIATGIVLVTMNIVKK